MQRKNALLFPLSNHPGRFFALWGLLFLSLSLGSCQARKLDPGNLEFLGQGTDSLPTQTAGAFEIYNSPTNSILGITFEYPAGWLWTRKTYEGTNLETLETGYPGNTSFGISILVIPLEEPWEGYEEKCLVGVPTDEDVVVVPPITLERDEIAQISGYEARWITVRRESAYANVPVEILECIEINTEVNHISVVGHIPEDEREKWFGQGFDLIVETLEINQ